MIVGSELWHITINQRGGCVTKGCFLTQKALSCTHRHPVSTLIACNNVCSIVDVLHLYLRDNNCIDPALLNDKITNRVS